MTYLWLALGFVVASAAAGLMFARVGSSRQSTRTNWAIAALTFLVLAILTAVFDTLMIGMELFHYDPTQLIGVRIGLAPIEDFSYPLACALLLPPLWLALTGRRRQKQNARRHSGLVSQALLVSRPVSWINTAYPFAAAMLLTTREIDWVLIVGTIYFLVPYNLAMYGINDVFDYASDLHNPRKGGIEGALLAPQLHRPLLWLVAVTNVPFLIVLAGAGGLAAWISLAFTTFMVIAYSAPVLRFKERPVLDSITSSTHFVNPAIVGFALAGVHITPGLMLLLAAFFLWGMAAHAFGAVQDIGPDRDAGIASIATVFGARRTVRLSMMAWTLAGLAMLATPWPGPFVSLIALPYLLNAAPWWNVTDSNAADTNRSWRRFIWLNYGSGFLVTLALILFWRQTS